MSEDALYAVEIRYDVRIPVRDGLKLSANVFMPVARATNERFPAILEMLPYRKDDWRHCSDHQRMTYFAQRGYAGCRLDIRGTGSSPGIARDEYTPEETRDGYDAVGWLAAQPWCNGNIGMWGISYGGFTALQVAMLRPPALKAIIPMYATDARYTDDVHYNGGCLTASDLAQYAISMVAMNAMPPRAEYVGHDWAAQWKARLEQTPPWLIEWLRQQTDGPYWRVGSVALDYARITCAIFQIGGWADSYTSPVLRIQERCVNAPRKALIGPWVHSLPDSAYPGPNIDYLHEMTRFFDYWLKGIDNGVMDESPLTIYREEYTPPEAFPARKNGAWHSEAAYPIARTQLRTFYLEAGTLQERRTENWAESIVSSPLSVDEERRATDNSQQTTDTYPHRPTHGTRAALCWGAGGPPNGLARDLRPDEALIPTYTSALLTEGLDVIGFPEAILYLSSTAPVAHVVVRLTDVAPDGVSAMVSAGVLNLTHRESHTEPRPLAPGEIYEVCVPLKATGYRFLPGHRIRLSVASAYWPAIWPSPYPADNRLHRGADTPSRLILPFVPPSADLPAPPDFKTTSPDLIATDGGSEEPGMWRITEDVLEGSVTVEIYGGDTTVLPDGRSLFNAERLLLTAYERDPAHVQLANEFINRLPHELSGGQRQRVVIAAALVTGPRLLVADEPVSMLDVSIRAEILLLLNELRRRHQISILFITHDLATAALFADRIAVMYLGRIVEIGPASAVLENPLHPYTKALLSVIPNPDPRHKRKRVILQGETPNPADIPPGCRFHPRCPVAVEACRATDPRLELKQGHEVACIRV